MSGLIRSLVPLEDSLDIRVNGVAPGISKTPMWTHHPEKLSLFDEATDIWNGPEEVADAMLRCVEDPEVVGGWVLEVTKGRSRNDTATDAPGPEGPGVGVSNAAVNVAEVYSWLGADGWGVAK